ncbi:retrovirus-related pol polyprotein from transposon TNT 1-94 [Tanacetum coccineum]
MRSTWKTILDVLQKEKLYARIFKVSEFWLQNYRFLGHVVQTVVGIHVDPSKVESVKNWKTPESSQKGLHPVDSKDKSVCAGAIKQDEAFQILKEKKLWQCSFVLAHSPLDLMTLLVYYLRFWKRQSEAFQGISKAPTEWLRGLEMTLLSNEINGGNLLSLIVSDSIQLVWKRWVRGLDMSTVTTLRTDGIRVMYIQDVSKELLRACVWDFSGSWDTHAAPLIETEKIVQDEWKDFSFKERLKNVLGVAQKSYAWIEAFKPLEFDSSEIRSVTFGIFQWKGSWYDLVKKETSTHDIVGTIRNHRALLTGLLRSLERDGRSYSGSRFPLVYVRLEYSWQGAEYTWEHEDPIPKEKYPISFLCTRTFLKCRNLSLEDKALLTEGDLIMEYLVKISKKARILEFKRRHLKITVPTTNTSKLLKTLSLDESRSPEFNLFSNLEEYSEEEVAETMAETMEQYTSKTLVDYGSGIARPKIDDKDNFELKGQFLKAFPMSLTGVASCSLRNKPSVSVTTWEDLKTKFLSKYFPPARTAKKMEEINNFQQEPDETLYQAWDTETSDGLAAIQAQLNNLGREIKKANEKVYAAQVGCEQHKGPHYTKDFPLKEEGKTLEEAYYTQFGRLFQGGGYRAAAPGFYYRNNANPSYQERRQSIKETLSKFMSKLVKIHEENSNMIKEIRVSTDAAVRNQGALIKTLEIQIGQISKVLQERGFGSLPRSTEANPRDHVKLISTAAKADSNSIRRIGSPQYAVSTPQNKRFMFESRKMTIPFPSRLNDYYYKEKKGSYGPSFLEAFSYEASHIDKSIPRKEKDLGSFTLPCYINNVCYDNALADLGASVSVMPLSTYLNLGLGELAHTKLIVELAYRTMKYPKGIAENVLVGIGKFVFPIDFIILDMPEDVKVPLILGRPFLSTAYAKIDVFKRNFTLRIGDEKVIFKSVKPSSSLIKRVYMLSLRERMELDLEARLMGETLVLNKSLDPLYGDYIELNDLNIPLELRKDQVYDLMPTIEEVMENMDGYRDQDMGDIILREPFCKASCVEEKMFDGLITIRNGSDNVTYQMARSRLRFKHLSNAQCNKIKPLLKVSLHDKLNGISHPYQKLKSFYKGVLNLGPEYVRDAKMEEWLTRGHISVHEME